MEGRHVRHTRSIPGRSASPTARALVALELIQARPGITADELGLALGVTGRAARRYVAILREAELPIESVSGPYGGYRVGRGLRLPPLMFTAAEAAGLVMATLEGHPGAADPADVVGGALGKILRSLPDRVAVALPEPTRPATPYEHLDRLLAACSSARLVQVSYGLGDHASEMVLEPWAVVLRHSRWYLLCWSRSRSARRVLRVDRVLDVVSLPETFTPPADLDALRTIEESFSQGWPLTIEVLVDAPPSWVSRWVPRSLALLEPVGEDRTRMVATTEDPDWYARQLAAIPVSFTVVEGPELRAALAALAARLAGSAGPAGA
ncbi:helix-turn-helix transcriptional regulator [Nocardioides mangrovi]|uniref:WYL domain-containing protein n=1 Tax=Nocardioides mangrovi TaxID=2874580 RepID=A0ABS7UAE0_9ACTN|nr:WYL domain-containing protein [Nocardioides mangrovi]MBZ5737951.1 WYL domain-containing protein [Nocardioides mangrovi]